MGRYTFIGLTPFKRIVARGREITITEGKRVVEIEDDIFAVLRRALSGHKPARLPGLPPFTAGAVGFFSYDVVRQIERLPNWPRMNWAFRTPACSFSTKCWLLTMRARKSGSWLRPTSPAASPPMPTIRPWRGSTSWRGVWPNHSAQAACSAQHGRLKVKHRTSKKNYLAGVDRIREYIAAGDIFQAVLSQRFDVEPETDQLQVYRTLRTVNPSPYMYFLRCATRWTAGRSAGQDRKGRQEGKNAHGAGSGTGRLLAGAAGARARGQGGVPAHCRHPPARRQRG